MNKVNLPSAVSGGIVYWNCNPSSRDLIEALYRAHDLQDFVPPARTDDAALQAALRDEHGGPTRIVQPHKKRSSNGFEVVRVDRQEERNDYTVDFCAKVAEGRVSTWYGEVDRYQLQEKFNYHKITLTGSAVGKSLVEILAKLGGVSLRPSGGIYWIPEGAVETWLELAQGVEKAAEGEKPNSVFLLSTVMDENTVRAVKDAITAEVSDAATALATEVVTGNLGEVALEARKQRALVLHQRVTHYSAILGDALQTLQDIVTVAEQAAASALAVQQHGAAGEFAGIF